MLVGYARTSTVEQVAGLEAQARLLETASVERLFSEHVSATSAQRPALAQALDFVREGDVLIVTKLDRLARSTAHLLEIVEQLNGKGVSLRILDFGGGVIDTNSPQGKLTLTMFAAFAEFERALMLERQREGIAKAKRDGKYTGRKPLPRAKIAEIRRLRTQSIPCAEIAKAVGVSRASVYRALAD